MPRTDVHWNLFVPRLMKLLLYCKLTRLRRQHKKLTMPLVFQAFRTKKWGPQLNSASPAEKISKHGKTLKYCKNIAKHKIQ
ncbi:hypothetical protein NDU88_002621 [Pleurodeles waltl]|uniref:Uncharacterized protein n=1 Tax=Pleurodeles waltl TaxID=8319 RepID=A0AAV7V090_PLEWA|nr:hypothetical protein NDU88_002621 [Pleurodeles waltl]